jgi:hypothetical protein
VGSGSTLEVTGRPVVERIKMSFLLDGFVVVRFRRFFEGFNSNVVCTTKVMA